MLACSRFRAASASYDWWWALIINHSGLPSLAVRLINSDKLDLYFPAAHCCRLVNSCTPFKFFKQWKYGKFFLFGCHFPLGLAEVKWYFHVAEVTKANQISCSARISGIWVSVIMKTSEHSYLRDVSSVAGVTGSLHSTAHPKILCCLFMSINFIFMIFFSFFNNSVT